jgi:hypothetical protein
VGVQPLEVLPAVGRVHADEQVVGGAPVDHHVVHDAARIAADTAVHGLAVGALREVVGEEPLQRLQRPGSAEDHLAHVRYVEEPGAGPHRGVLVEDPRVLDRHVPAGELDDPGAAADVDVVEGGSLGHVDPGWRG